MAHCDPAEFSSLHSHWAAHNQQHVTPAPGIQPLLASLGTLMCTYANTFTHTNKINLEKYIWKPDGTYDLIPGHADQWQNRARSSKRHPSLPWAIHLFSVYAPKSRLEVTSSRKEPDSCLTSAGSPAWPL